MIWELKAVESNLDVNSFADIAIMNQAIWKSKKVKSNDTDIDKLIALEETLYLLIYYNPTKYSIIDANQFGSIKLLENIDYLWINRSF